MVKYLNNSVYEIEEWHKKNAHSYSLRLILSYQTHSSEKSIILSLTNMIELRSSLCNQCINSNTIIARVDRDYMYI